MSATAEYAIHLEKENRLRENEARAAEREARADRTALEMAFHEQPGCVEACFDACIHTAACQSLTNPVHAALAGWIASLEASVAGNWQPKQRAAAAQSDEVTSLRFAGASYREIAQATGLSIATVTRICRAEAA
jgi:hypothetical protein